MMNFDETSGTKYQNISFHEHPKIPVKGVVAAVSEKERAVHQIAQTSDVGSADVYKVTCVCGITCNIVPGNTCGCGRKESSQTT